MQLVNLMEEMVAEALDRLRPELGELADDDLTRLDIMALALNQLCPRYVVSLRGQIISRLHAESPQTQAEITTVLLKAIDHVRHNPTNAPEPATDPP